MPLIKQLERLLSLRADARLLAYARILVGVSAVAAAFELWRLLPRVLDPLVIQLPYALAVPRLPKAALPIFIGVWLLVALAFTSGFKTRLAGALLTAMSWYTLLLDQQTYSNHFYLLCLLMLLVTLADSGAALSIDALTRGTRKTVAGWPVMLLKLQASIVYGFSALAKLTPQYLSGDVLAATMKQPGWLMQTSGVSLLAVSAIVVELFIAFGLWSSRLRVAAVIAGVALHVFIFATLDSSRLSLGMFALEMFALYPLFFQRSDV